MSTPFFPFSAIKADEDYQEAKRLIQELTDKNPEQGTKDFYLLDRLIRIVKAYERTL